MAQRPPLSGGDPVGYQSAEAAAGSHQGRLNSLRAAVLGANDGIVSTAGIVIGVAGATTDAFAILAAGVAGLTAGALSMAAGEYVSVSSQRDTEHADLARERSELEAFPEAELNELASIYERRGLSPALAREVAVELSASDQLAVHARDELGINPDELANPVQASVVSALSFVAGAILPIIVVAVTPAGARVVVTMIVTLIGLVALGSLGARLGGANAARGGGAALLATAVRHRSANASSESPPPTGCHSAPSQRATWFTSTPPLSVKRPTA